MLYRDAFGVGVERTQQVLSGLEKKVQEMLEIRRQVVIRRDGTVDQLSPQPGHGGVAESATSPPSIRFAGATFSPAPADESASLLFISDDSYAKSAVQALESMGLAGKWQKAGTCQVSIQNSGPPGAAVSIRIRLGDHPIESAAKALAGIGIELC